MLAKSARAGTKFTVIILPAVISAMFSDNSVRELAHPITITEAKYMLHDRGTAA
jgi:hypothetical protein